MIPTARRVGAVLLACLALTAPGRADHELPPHVPAHDLWRYARLVDDAGLTGSFAMHVAIDDAGVVWIATANGLVRYDGYVWETFTTRDGLPSDFVRCVTIARDGTLWVGTADGLVRRTEDGFRPVDTPAPFPNIRRVVEAPDGALWICADTWRRSDVASGLARWSGGTWTVWRDDLPDEYVCDARFTRDGRFFVLARTGLYERVGTEWQRPLAALIGAKESPTVWGLIETRDGLFAATRTAFFEFDGATWHRHDQPIPDAAYAKSLFAIDGIAHVYDGAHANPVARWAGDGFRPFGPVIEPRGYVEHAQVAPDGSVWLVGYDLITRWSRDAEWTAVDLPPPSGLDAAGSLWFVGDRGATVRTEAGWHAVPEIRGQAAFADDGPVWSWQGSRLVSATPGRPFELREYATDVRIAAVLPTPGGGAWAVATDATRNCRVALLDEGDWRWRTSVPWSATAEAFGRSVTSEGDLLLALRDGLHARLEVFRVGAETVDWLGSPPTDTHQGGAVTWTDDAPWMWGPFGTWRYERGQWEEITGLPAPHASLVEQRGEEIWIVSEGTWGGRDGVSVLRNGRWTHLDARIQHDGGRGPDGTLFFIDDDNAITLARPGSVHLSRVHFPGAEPIVAAWGDALGDIWVATAAGVYRYCADGVPPKTFVDRSTLQFTEGQAIAPRVHAVERYRPRAASVFEYSWRLDGGAWSSYAALPQGLELPAGVGRRELAIRARDQGGDADPEPAVATVSVLPRPLQSRPWFLPVVLATTLSIALLAATLAYSRYQLRRHARGLQRTVAARTQDLRKTSALLRATFDHIPFDVWACDAEGRYAHQNLASRRRWGPLVGTWPGDADRVTAGDAGRAERHRRALAGEIVTSDVRYLVDGQPIECISVIAPIRDDGAIIGLVGLDVDVTEQRRAEGQLRDSRHRFRRLAEASPSIIVQFDATANPTYVNHRWAALTGRPRSEARQHGWWDSIDEADRADVRQSLLDALHTRTQWQQEFRVRHVDGRVVWLLAHGVPIRDGPRRGLIGVCLDISDRRDLDERRRRLASELDHRVKNNLAWVLSLITVTRESCTSIDEFVPLLSSRVHAIARTHERLATSRWRGVGVDHLVRDTLAGVEPSEGVEIDGPDVMLEAAVAGPLALCLHELVTNAVKHGAIASPGGRIELTWARVETLGLELTWRERFGAPTTSPAEEGVGLGLVRGLVKRDLRGTLDLRMDRYGVLCTMTFPCVACAVGTEVKPAADGPPADDRDDAVTERAAR